MARGSLTAVAFGAALVACWWCCFMQVDGQTVWPKPQSQSDGSASYSLSPSSFAFEAVGFNSDILLQAIQRYRAIAFYRYPWRDPLPNANANARAAAAASLTGININVLTGNQTLSLETNESYTLQVSAPTVKLTAVTVYGALRGLETFAQLVTPSYAGNGVTEYSIKQTTINDAPRFPHRGYLLDTSRHYLPLSILYQQIDALSYNKFNVLHWHIVDDESFPYVSDRWPLLSGKGAYDQHHTYTKEQIQSVITYAQYRGVRVIPEFDTPGHTQSWGVGYPDLLTPCYTGSKPNGQRYAMYPIANFTYEFVSTLFAEVRKVFPDAYLHIGGDEVSFDCWASNPDIRDWMRSAGYGDNYQMLESYYETRILDICQVLGLDYIVWQEIFDNGLKLKPSTVVEVWKDPWQSEMYNVTKAGFRALLSTPWYINYISYGEVWPSYYQIEPLSFNGTAAQNALVMGGEACMWGEYVDATNSISRTWPSASAVGERLWSAQNVTDLTDATNRIQELTCKLLKRGLALEPPNGPSFCDVEFESFYAPPWVSQKEELE